MILLGIKDDSGRGSAATAARFNNGHATSDSGGGLKASHPPPVRHVSSEASEVDAATNLLKTTSISDDQLLQVGPLFRAEGCENRAPSFMNEISWTFTLQRLRQRRQAICDISVRVRHALYERGPDWRWSDIFTPKRVRFGGHDMLKLCKALNYRPKR